MSLTLSISALSSFVSLKKEMSCLSNVSLNSLISSFPLRPHTLILCIVNLPFLLKVLDELLGVVVLLLGWIVLLLGLVVLDITLGVLVVLYELLGIALLLGMKVLFISLEVLIELLPGLIVSSLLLVVVTPVWPVCTPSVTLVALRWPILSVLVSPSTVRRLIVGLPTPRKLVRWLSILSI